MRIQSERNVPCTTCRVVHASCNWSKGITSCDRCSRLRVACSGPLRKARPACENCKHVKARCKWIDGGPCQRCKRLGRHCGPRARLKSEICAPSPIRSETFRQSETGLLTRPTTQVLIEQGRLRLNVLDCALKEEWSGMMNGQGSVVEELLDILACSSCLKFSGNIIGPRSTVEFRPLEKITTRLWLEAPQQKLEIRYLAIRSLWRRAWALLPKLFILSALDRHNLKKILTAVRLAWKLGLDAIAEPRLSQRLLAFVVLKAAPEFEKDWDDSQDKIKHAGSALQLAIHEAEIATTLGEPSYIPEDIFRKLLALTSQTSAPLPDLSLLMGITANNSSRVMLSLKHLFLAPIMDSIHLQKRQLADCFAPFTLQAVSLHWAAMEDLLARLDFLTMTVTVHNSYTEVNADSTAVLDVLRAIGQVELRLLHNVVLSLLIARRLTDLGINESIAKWTSALVQRMRRISDAVMTHECAMSQVYPVLDIFAQVMYVGCDFLLPAIKCLDATPRQLVTNALKVSSFWHCGAKQLMVAWARGQ